MERIGERPGGKACAPTRTAGAFRVTVCTTAVAMALSVATGFSWQYFKFADVSSLSWLTNTAGTPSYLTSAHDGTSGASAILCDHSVEADGDGSVSKRRADAVQRLLERASQINVLRATDASSLGPGPLLILMRHAFAQHNVLLRRRRRSDSEPDVSTC